MIFLTNSWSIFEKEDDNLSKILYIKINEPNLAMITLLLLNIIMEINARSQIKKNRGKLHLKKDNIQQHTTWKTSTHIFALAIYKTNTKLMESIPSILMGMSKMICQLFFFCDWHIKHLVATFRHVLGLIHICWLLICIIF